MNSNAFDILCGDFYCSALGYMIGSEVSALVHDLAHVNDSWRWALRVNACLLGNLF